MLAGKYGASNTYILKSGKEAAVVDPSAPLDIILSELSGCELKYILLTHGHFDHVFTLDELRDATGAEAFIHSADITLPLDGELNASSLFLETAQVARTPENTLKGSDILPLGEETVKVIHTPGHTKGSVCFDCGDKLVTGDTLFDLGYGRYDLPGGDPYELAASLRMLAAREDDPVIYPGHGYSCPLSQADFVIHFRKNL